MFVVRIIISAGVMNNCGRSLGTRDIPLILSNRQRTNSLLHPSNNRLFDPRSFLNNVTTASGSPQLLKTTIRKNSSGQGTVDCNGPIPSYPRIQQKLVPE